MGGGSRWAGMVAPAAWKCARRRGAVGCPVGRVNVELPGGVQRDGALEMRWATTSCWH